MSESERRRKYRHDRVLIETARVLSSTFDDAVVFLSGVQLEMLRNVTQYLRRLETYVTEYNPGYYLTPTPDDYDDILATVADLEETLMGNPNTIWGFSDVWQDRSSWGDATAGDHSLVLDAVAAGKVVKLEGVSFMDEDSVMDRLVISVLRSGNIYPMVDIADPPAGVWHAYSFDRTLEEGDRIQFDAYGVTVDDALWWIGWGSEMDITT